MTTAQLDAAYAEMTRRQARREAKKNRVPADIRKRNIMRAYYLDAARDSFRGYLFWKSHGMVVEARRNLVFYRESLEMFRKYDRHKIGGDVPFTRV